MPDRGSARRHPLRALLPPLAALLTVTACTAQPVTSDRAVAVSDATPGPTTGTADGSLDDLLWRAEQELLKTCMQAKGFPFWPKPKNPVPEYREFPYVLDDVGWARRNGYGTKLLRQLDDALADDPNERYFRSLPPSRAEAAATALNGPRLTDPDAGLRADLPTGGSVRRSDQGCTSDAERTLYGDLPAWYRAGHIHQSLRSLQRQQVLGDAEFVAATHDWSKCMAQRGHRYTDPQALRAYLDDNRDTVRPEQEITLAVAEASCAQSSGLAARASALEGKHWTGIRQRYHAEIDEWNDLRRAAEPRATALVRAAAASPTSPVATATVH